MLLIAFLEIVLVFSNSKYDESIHLLQQEISTDKQKSNLKSPVVLGQR